MITANEANKIARDKIEANRKQAFKMVENYVEISAKCGRFQATIGTDEIISKDTLEEIAKLYGNLGYECSMKEEPMVTKLVICW